MKQAAINLLTIFSKGCYMQFKKILFVSYFLFAFQFCFASIEKVVDSIPNPKQSGYYGYVSDRDNILSLTEKDQINSIIRQIEATTTDQIAVAIVNSIGHEVPKQIATALFNKWGIGQKDKRNGLLLLVVLDQHKWEFETGYGMEETLPDVICSRIGRTYLTPSFKEGKYAEGIVNALSKIRIKLCNLNENDTLLFKGENINIETATSEPEIINRSKNGYRQESFFQKYVDFIFLALFVFVFPYIIACTVLVVYRIGRNSKIASTSKSPRAAIDQMLLDHKNHWTMKWGLLFLPLLIYYLWYTFIWKRSIEKRFSPKINEATGNEMVLLNEEDDDKYLSDGQKEEEKLFSIDYDVWMDSKTSEIKIIKFPTPTFLSSKKYIKCSKCSYVTMSQIKDVCISGNTYKRTFKCSFCGNIRTETYTVSSSSSESSSGSSSGGSGGGSSGGSFGGGSSGGGGAGGSW